MSEWKRGPLPKDTYGWGGVVPFDAVGQQGFFFADFKGDKVTIPGTPERILMAHEVAWYDNSLTLPPNN